MISGPPQPRFSLADAERANSEWGCNCGPAALAAITGKTLDEVRPHMGDFERKGYTNPTLMFAALKSIGRQWRNALPRFPSYGLARIQWEGPWTLPGVPIRARYRFTHWIAVARPSRYGDTGIFDVNALNNGSGWVCFADWSSIVVPWILEQCVPRASGKWHVTHGIEIERPPLPLRTGLWPGNAPEEKPF